MEDYTNETDCVLRDAGWNPGRRVDTGELRRRLEQFGFVVSEAAERFLSEFNGLVFDISGPGISRARESFKFEPLWNEGEDDRFTKRSQTIGESLTPIGVLDQRYPPWYL
ncbi:SUKH-3 immunity protein [Penicillium riverlandense]|uniref:SUKH-3 immunity protein n=1 Tax=Penicillium riverlandense TaxID=1903569 RepID=UPI002548B6C8|nr:SUKH-3 immunity protein [Penicillium riverlandense]KAJ5804995.1 SUKH-3 immunity protein [Penicillium riverlandense]